MPLLDTILAQVQGSNILLLLMLVVLFILAYRVLRAVINAAIVAVLSGLFLVALNYIGLGPEVTVNSFMFFMVLGTGLFLLYSGIATVLSTSSSVYSASRQLWTWLRKPFRSRGRKEKEEKEEGDKEKEIVLEELKDE